MNELINILVFSFVCIIIILIVNFIYAAMYRDWDNESWQEINDKNKK